MNWYALQVTATLNSNIITVQDGDDVAILTDKHWIKVGNSKPYKIQSTRINSSNVPQIILTANFTDSTRTTEAFAARSFDDLQVLVERATLLKDTAEPKINNFSTYTKSILDTTDASQFRSKLGIVPNTRTISGSTHVEVTGDFTQDEIELSLKDTVARKGHANDQVMTNEDLSKKFYSVDEKAVWDKFLNSCTLIFDFQNDYYEVEGQPKTLTEAMSFSRSSTRTNVNKNGQIETIPVNQPAFAYDPVTKKLKGISIHEGVQNRVLWSDDLTKSVWIKDNGCAVAAETDADPLYVDTNRTNGVYSSVAGAGVSQSVTAANTTGVHTLSVFMKRGQTNISRIEYGSAYLEYNWNDGTTTTSGLDREFIEDYGRGYIRINMCFIPSVTNGSVKIIPNTQQAGSIRVLGVDFTSFIVEVDHIKTEGSVVSNSTDLLTFTNTGEITKNGTYVCFVEFKNSENESPHQQIIIGESNSRRLLYVHGSSRRLATYDSNIPVYNTNKISNSKNFVSISYDTNKTIFGANSGISIRNNNINALDLSTLIFGVNNRSYVFSKFYFSPQSFTEQEVQILSKPRI